MRFITNEHKVECRRAIFDHRINKEREIIVTRFDEELTTIPPHVSASLTPSENQALDAWLEERSNIKAEFKKQTVEESVLETLPDLLTVAQEALKDVEVIDLSLYRELKNNIRELDEHLNHFKNIGNSPNIKTDSMQNREVLKEKLKLLETSL